MTRIRANEYNVQKGNEIFSERVHMADPDFFRMFDFPLLTTQSDNPLKELYSVVLTEKLAKNILAAKIPLAKR
jgi:putative ABC transport system permease protein